MLEIERLRRMLMEAGIPFDFEKHAVIAGWQLSYPANTVKERICSVIQGERSYGGRANKLEIAGLLTDEEREGDDVAGWLTAEEVFARIKRHWEAHHEEA